MEPTLFIELLKRAANTDRAIAKPAIDQFATAAATPYIKEAVFPGDIFSDLFTIEKRQPNQEVRYETDLINPGREREFSAFVLPAHGQIPNRLVEPDYIRVPTFEYGNALDIPLKALEVGDYNAVQRALEVLQAGIVEQINDNCWRTMIGAGVGRNIVSYDPNYAPGKLSKQLLGIMTTKMRRAAGGNSSSVNKFKMSRLYMSPEVRQSVLDWDNHELDDYSRREVITSDEGKIVGLAGVEFRDIDELGVSQRYATYYDTTLGADYPTYTRNAQPETKTELLVGVDTNRKLRLVLPLVKQPVVFEDGTAHRAGKASWYCRFEYGVGVLDARVILLGAA